jgi:hypothetical protein
MWLGLAPSLSRLPRTRKRLGAQRVGTRRRACIWHKGQGLSLLGNVSLVHLRIPLGSSKTTATHYSPGPRSKEWNAKISGGVPRAALAQSIPRIGKPPISSVFLFDFFLRDVLMVHGSCVRTAALRLVYCIHGDHQGTAPSCKQSL